MHTLVETPKRNNCFNAKRKNAGYLIGFGINRFQRLLPVTNHISDILKIVGLLL